MLGGKSAAGQLSADVRINIVLCFGICCVTRGRVKELRDTEDPILLHSIGIKKKAVPALCNIVELYSVVCTVY